MIVAETQITAVRVDVSRVLRRRPAGHLLSRRPRFASRQRVPGIVEMYHLLEALEVAVVHVRLHEIRPRALVDIPHRRNPEATVELRCKLFPSLIRVFRASQEIADAFVYNGLALWIGHIAERVGLCLMIESEIRVARNAEIGCRVVREERMMLSLRVDMAVEAFRLTIE